MKPLGLILARAGSTGVPSKNRAPLADRPCIAWTMDDARNARSLSRIAVSTDDAEIQHLALSSGFDVVARPADLASDTARVDDAARHAVESLDDVTLDPIVILYANVPIRPVGLIDRALSIFKETGADSVQSYAPVGKHHPYWTCRLDDDTARVTPWESDTLNHNIHRRQDLPPACIPDGGVLVVSRKALLLEIPNVPDGPHAFFGADRRGVLTEPGAVIDIDSPLDLLIADTILNQRAAQTPNFARPSDQTRQTQACASAGRDPARRPAHKASAS